MKKIYIAPTMICVKMKKSRVLTGSLNGDGLNMRINSTTISGSADAREADFDDEDF